jgi:heavy metal translocating P-type ATPase
MQNIIKGNGYFYINITLNVSLVIVLLTLLILRAVNLTPPVIIFEIVSVIALIPVVISAASSLKEREISVDFLAIVALVFAYLTHEWYSAAFINLMLSSARIFDIWTQRRSENLIKSLLKYRPEKARVQTDGSYEIKDIDDIVVGDVVIVEVGGRIPIDGVVVSGQASVDESTLTGESVPKFKKTGDHVYSSTLNMAGSLFVKTERVASESTLAKIISLVEESSLKKSKTIKMVHAFTRWYVIATLAGAVIIYLFTGNLALVLAVLLVVCADDIAVSVPLAFTAAISSAAQHGILIKSSDVLESMTAIDTFITDKTGTLTFGKPKIVSIETFGSTNLKDFLKDIGTAESNSSHPISKSIVDYVEAEKIIIPEVNNFNETPGEGIEVTSGKDKIIAGKIDFVVGKTEKLDSDQAKRLDIFIHSGHSITLVAVNKKLRGFVVFEDEVRPSAKTMIAETKLLGTKLWIMLTGDNHTVAKKVADEVGIDRFETNLTPKDKPNFIEKIKKERMGTVAMVGDGVNDAAALAIADVSFAMGVVGSDVAINAADVALMNDDLMKIPESIILARKTRAIVLQCFGIWGITNIVGLSLVAFGVLAPTGAATYNFLTDFLPIFNALRTGINKK